MKKYKIGYTQGTFDLFHVGHLNLLNNAKKLCDYLIVGVNTDTLVNEYKNKNTIINQEDRLKIVYAIKAVDEVILTNSLDKTEIVKNKNIDAIFIGDDWKGNDRWDKTKEEMNKMGVEVIFLPYTSGISSSDIRSKLKKN